MYKGSDGSLLSMDDLIAWLKMFKIYHPEYKDWDFDAITGSINEFLDPEDYFNAKEFYKKHII